MTGIKFSSFQVFKFSTLALLLLASTASAQKPSAIDYTLRIDSADLSVFNVEMRLHDAPATFTLAAAAHPEYDDKYWRYLEGIQVADARGHAAVVTRADSVRWQVTVAPGEVLVHYRIRPPAVAPPRAAWRAFLTPTGGVAGGPHTFLYVLGAERAAATVRMDIPASWRALSGLPAGAGDRVFTAPNMDVLMDSPILIGRIRDWQFEVKGVPHIVTYLQSSGTVAFDSVAFVDGIARYVRQTVALFGKNVNVNMNVNVMPYQKYVFMFEDDAFGGGLEHVNSVTLGATSAELAKDAHAAMPEVAHEFFHTWNLMNIRPAEYRGVDYRTQPPVAELWFSEGLTLFYSDLLRRRAGLPTSDSTRVSHLEYLIRSYLANPGYGRFSAEQVSRVAYNSAPGALGDNSLSTHQQGEVMGAMLDMVVRSATNGAKSMDDVMRLMQKRFSGARGYTGADVEQAVEDVCGCDVTDFFNAYVRGAGAIDFDRYLGLLGLRTTVTWGPALAADGSVEADMRIRGFEPANEAGLRLLLWNTMSVWVQSGLHTGDPLVSINGTLIRTWPELRTMLSRLHIGDTARFVVARPAGKFETTVTITGYDRPFVQIEETPAATEQQKRLRAAWLAGT